MNISELKEWADGIQGSQGTEHAHKITDIESQLAHAIMQENRNAVYKCLLELAKMGGNTTQSEDHIREAWEIARQYMSVTDGC